MVAYFCTLSVAEFGLRLAKVSYPVFETFDSFRGKILRPGKQGWCRADGEGFIAVNNLGIRDDDHEAKKPIRTFRIAVWGDSYVEAREMALEDVFWKKT